MPGWGAAQQRAAVTPVIEGDICLPSGRTGCDTSCQVPSPQIRDVRQQGRGHGKRSDGRSALHFRSSPQCCDGTRVLHKGKHGEGLLHHP